MSGHEIGYLVVAVEFDGSGDEYCAPESRLIVRYRLSRRTPALSLCPHNQPALSCGAGGESAPRRPGGRSPPSGSGAGCLADGERISDWRSRRTVLRRNHQRRSAEDRASDERAKAQEGQRNAGQAAPLRPFGRGLSVIIVISRSEERRVGQECVRTGKHQWWPYT